MQSYFQTYEFRQFLSPILLLIIFISFLFLAKKIERITLDRDFLIIFRSADPNVLNNLIDFLLFRYPIPIILEKESNKNVQDVDIFHRILPCAQHKILKNIFWANQIEPSAISIFFFA